MASKGVSDKPYRKGVGIVLLNSSGEVFIAQRCDRKEPAWQMPQGGMHEGEDPLVAALRELEEEIGTANAEFIAESEGWLHYDFPPEIQSNVWKGRYRGQKQKWFLMRFSGHDKEVNLNTRNPEFSDWKWTTLQNLPNLIVGFKKNLYRQVIEAFARLVKPEG